MQKLPFIRILASKISFSFDMKCTNMVSLDDVLVNANNIPIMIEKEFTVECCVRCHHVYQSKWEAKVNGELKACHETRPGALVEDKYAMVLKHKDVTVGHVPKFLSKKTTYFCFYLKHGGDLLVKIIGKKQFSKDLPDGEMELPALYISNSTNLVMHSKLSGLVSDAIKTYSDAKSKALETKDEPKKKKNK